MDNLEALGLCVIVLAVAAIGLTIGLHRSRRNETRGVCRNCGKPSYNQWSECFDCWAERQ